MASSAAVLYRDAGRHVILNSEIGDRAAMSTTETSLMTQSNSTPSADVYDDGYLRVEHDNYSVACNGTPIKLPRTEFLIFSRLTRTPDRIVTAEALWTSVWGSDKPLNSESLHVYIYRLRVKLASYGLQI